METKRWRGSCSSLLTLAVIFFGGVRVPFAAEPLPTSEDCLACHSDPELSKTGPGRRQISLFVDQASFQGSVHGFLGCVQCHVDATGIPHPEALKKVQCQTCHEAAISGAHALLGGKGPACSACHGSHAIGPPPQVESAICKNCHAPVVEVYNKSVHGMALVKGNGDVALCLNCHGSVHELRKVRDPGSPVYPLNLPRTCGACHGDPELAKRHGIPVVNAYQLYMDSIHGRALERSGLLVAANCSSCHGFHGIRPKDDPASKVNRMNVPSTCGTCHAGILVVYAESVHGKAVRNGDEGPVCSDCHSAHQIRRVEGAPWQLEVIRECGTCHEESLRTYRDTFHGKVTALGFTRVAKCSDCHTAHAIFPSADPRSAVSREKIVLTCQQCHPQATASFAEFHPHADYHNKDRFPKLYYTYLFMTTLLVAVMSLFGLHTVLWLPRSLLESIRRRRTGVEEESEP